MKTYGCNVWGGSRVEYDPHLDQWRAAVMPFYEQDQAARAAIQEKVLKLTKLAALSEVGSTIPGACWRA